MTDAQRVLFDAITQGARGTNADPAEFLNEDGALRGPFNALLRVPDLGNAVQLVGEKVRFETSLPGYLRELAIITCARHWRSNYEWFAHVRIGRDEGLSEDTIDDVLHKRTPAAPDEAAVYTFVAQLNETGRVDDERYESSVTSFGEQAVTELVILSGYYALIAQLLNTFQVPVPAGETTPFDD